MGDIKDIDVTGLVSLRNWAPLGDAHELFVRAIMMRLGFEVGKVDLSSGPYDLIIVGCKRLGGERVFLRTQIKTIGNSLPLKGGSRGGVDRRYISGVKTYKYTEKHCDLILGVDRHTLDIYVFPTKFGSLYKSSVAKTRLQVCKNNWNILFSWNENSLQELQNKLFTQTS